MTEPADSSNQDKDIGALYVEPIRSLQIGAQENVVLREIIQLY